MIVSAYRRMQLYVDEYGLTELCLAGLLVGDHAAHGEPDQFHQQSGPV